MLLLVGLVGTSSAFTNAPLNEQISNATLPFPFKIWIPPQASNGGMTSGQYIYITVSLPSNMAGLGEASKQPALPTFQ